MCIGVMLTIFSWVKLDKQQRQYVVVFGRYRPLIKIPTTDFVPTSYLNSPGGVLTVCIGVMLTKLSWAKLDLKQ